MPKLKLNKRQIAFINNNRFMMSGSEMARKFQLDKNCVTRYMRKNGLTPPKDIIIKFRVKAMIGKTTSDKKTDSYLKKYYLVQPLKNIAKEIGRSNTFVRTRIRQLGLIIPKEIIEKRKADSYIKPGNIPLNKGKKQIEYMSEEAIEKTKATRFKKGQLPHNTKEKDGVITIRYEHPNRNGGRAYKYIRLAVGKWYPLHQYKWQKKHGKISAGMCLWFKDGNSLNCTLKNIELITRAENVKRNRANFFELPEELKTTKILINKINKSINGKQYQHIK